MKVRMGFSGVLFLFLIVSAVPVSGQGFPILGGLSDVSVNDPAVIEAAHFAVHAQEDREEGHGHGHRAKITLLTILGAREQVVAGMKYYLSLKVRIRGAEKEAEAVVWRQLSGVYELTSWEWK
jgi:hypothetical protein